jgi:hypothetical protein
MAHQDKQQLREEIAQEKFDKVWVTAMAQTPCKLLASLKASSPAWRTQSWEQLDSDEKMSVGGTIGGRR